MVRKFSNWLFDVPKTIYNEKLAIQTIAVITVIIVIDREHKLGMVNPDFRP